MAKILNTSLLTANYVLPDMTKKEISVNSNTTSTENMTTSFEKTRSSQKAFAFAGDKLLQTINLANNSDYDISQVNIRDDIGLGGSFEGGSVQVNGTSYPDYDISAGFLLPVDIAKGERVSITYNIIIEADPQTDIVNLVSNISYMADGESLQEQTNKDEISIESVQMVITKSASKSVVKKGDEITFTNIIENKGSANATDIVFTDPLPTGVTFVEGSLLIDGIKDEDGDPTKGVSLADIVKGGQRMVVFSVKVT